MITVHVRRSCGCCAGRLEFNSLASAEAAFQAAGLSSSAVIEDDAGDRMDDVDTFYGFSIDADEQRSRGLGYLAERVWDR